MPRVANPKHKWDHWLPPAQVVALSDLLAQTLGSAVEVTSLRANLRDDSVIDAPTLEALRQDLADVADREVEEVILGLSNASVFVYIQIDAPGVWGPEGRTQLSVSGESDMDIHGAFGTLKAGIDRVIDGLRHAEAEQQSKGAGGVNIGSIQVGSGSVAVSGEGPAKSVSMPFANNFLPNSRVDAASVHELGSAHTSPPWWNNLWLVTIAGGAIAAVIAGLILYWVLSH